MKILVNASTAVSVSASSSFTSGFLSNLLFAIIIIKAEIDWNGFRWRREYWVDGMCIYHVKIGAKQSCKMKNFCLKRSKFKATKLVRKFLFGKLFVLCPGKKWSFGFFFSFRLVFVCYCCAPFNWLTLIGRNLNDIYALILLLMKWPQFSLLQPLFYKLSLAPLIARPPFASRGMKTQPLQVEININNSTSIKLWLYALKRSTEK